MEFLKRIWNSSFTDKVNRVRLLQALDLPLNPGTEVLESSSIYLSRGKDFLFAAQKLLRDWNALIIRTAWNPDRKSSPYFHIRTQQEFCVSMQQLREICNNKACTNLIMHGEVIDSNDKNERKRFIAGRLMIHPSYDLPINETLEIVADEYFTKILDKSPRYYKNRLARLTRNIGRLRWHVEYKANNIHQKDITLALKRLYHIRSKLNDLITCIAHIFKCNPFDLTVLIEFTCCRGPDNTFIVFDFDYVRPKQLLI